MVMNTKNIIIFAYFFIFKIGLWFYGLMVMDSCTLNNKYCNSFSCDAITSINRVLRARKHGYLGKKVCC